MAAFQSMIYDFEDMSQQGEKNRDEMDMAAEQDEEDKMETEAEAEDGNDDSESAGMIGDEDEDGLEVLDESVITGGNENACSDNGFDEVSLCALRSTAFVWPKTHRTPVLRSSQMEMKFGPLLSGFQDNLARFLRQLAPDMSNPRVWIFNSIRITYPSWLEQDIAVVLDNREDGRVGRNRGQGRMFGRIMMICISLG